MWDKNKNFLGLKDKPKNGEPRYCLIVEPMVDSLQRQMLKSPAKCNYVFQIKGQPIPYRHIQSNYNRALKACGLYSQFKSTHILRHAAASIIRTQMGNLDYVQAITGHLDIRMAQLYAGAPDEKQKEAAQKLAEIIQKNADQK
jgi:integrase